MTIVDTQEPIQNLFGMSFAQKKTKQNFCDCSTDTIILSLYAFV